MEKQTTLECFQNYMRYIANGAAQVSMFGYDRIETYFDKVAHDIVKNNVDIYDLSKEELRELGCIQWDDTSELMLFPLWLAMILPLGTKISFIDDTDGELTKETDMDIRFGRVAFGIVPRA